MSIQGIIHAQLAILGRQICQAEPMIRQSRNLFSSELSSPAHLLCQHWCIMRNIDSYAHRRVKIFAPHLSSMPCRGEFPKDGYGPTTFLHLSETAPFLFSKNPTFLEEEERISGFPARFKSPSLKIGLL